MGVDVTLPIMKFMRRLNAFKRLFVLLYVSDDSLGCKNPFKYPQLCPKKIRK